MRHSFMLGMILWTLLAWGGGLYLQAAPPYEQGVEALKKGDLVSARHIFDQQNQVHPTAGAWANLGLIEWQSGRAGLAILDWERAIWLDPGNRAARQNLEFARQAAELEAPDYRWYEAASLACPAGTWAWLTGLGLWLAVGALVLPRVFHWHRPGWHQLALAIGLGLFLISATADWGIISRTQLGFVIHRNSSLRLIPTTGSELLTGLTPGDPVRQLKVRGQYVYVQCASGTGWLERDQIGLICVP